MKKVDKLDRKILRVISVDARRSFKEIAEQCGVSRAAIHQRVVRMFERGTITGSGYQINPKFLGFGTCSYIGIKLEKGSMYNAVVQELMKIPEVVECHFTTGPYTMLIKLYSHENEHLKDLLNNRIQSIPGVNSTDTMISLEQSIQRNIPINIEEEEEEEEEGMCEAGEGYDAEI
ncbi:MAG: Lrp/AsnC family transcriptional regulator [Alloprevotella sp.]